MSLSSAALVRGLGEDDDNRKDQRGDDKINDHPPHNNKLWERGEEEVALRRK